MYSKKKTWTPEDDARLLELAPTTTNDQIARFFGVSRSAIAGRLLRLGYRKRAHKISRTEADTSPKAAPITLPKVFRE